MRGVSRDEDGNGIHEVHPNFFERVLVLIPHRVGSAWWHFTRKFALVLRFFRVCAPCLFGKTLLHLLLAAFEAP